MKTAKQSFKSFAPPADPRYPEANKVFSPRAAGEAAHTPTPWHVETDGDFAGLCVCSEFGRVLQVCETAEIDEEAKSTAAFIVGACNSHAALVEALSMVQGVRNWAKEHAKGKARDAILGCCEWSKVDAALALAKEGKQ